MNDTFETRKGMKCISDMKTTFSSQPEWEKFVYYSMQFPWYTQFSEERTSLSPHKIGQLSHLGLTCKPPVSPSETNARLECIRLALTASLMPLMSHMPPTQKKLLEKSLFEFGKNLDFAKNPNYQEHQISPLDLRTPNTKELELTLQYQQDYPLLSQIGNKNSSNKVVVKYNTALPNVHDARTIVQTDMTWYPTDYNQSAYNPTFPPQNDRYF